MRARWEFSERHVAADGIRGVTAASRDGMVVLGLRRLDVWDSGDLSRLRRAAIRLHRAGQARIGIDLSSVSRLPPGFAALLWGWQDGGIAVSLFGAGPEVREMLWFRLSAVRDGSERWRIVAPRGVYGPSSPEPGLPSVRSG